MNPRGQQDIEMTGLDAIALFRRAFGYVAPFRRQFAVKTGLLLFSLLPILIMPWPIKIVIDHVITGIAIGMERQPYPFFIQPFVHAMAHASRTEILVVASATQLMMLIVVGAFGTQLANLNNATGSGQDTASRTENEANSGYSLISGLVGLFELRYTMRLTQLLNHHYRSRLYESVGDVGVLIPYFAGIATASVNIGALWIRVQESATGIGRVFWLMDLPSEADVKHATLLPAVRESVRLQGVSFEYEPGRPVLTQVSFEARVGELTAFVGQAGAGKTTVAYMIPRFLTPSSGRVLIDGHDISHVTLASLRSQVAFVFQETTLFDTTIAENLRLGNPQASDAALVAAAEAAGIRAFVESLPQGFDTRLGRAGGRLSVGQKQRLSIARALVCEAPIMIFDEPTSALDSETEATLVAMLEAESKKRIVIAHRLSTIRNARQILFLENGRVLEQGSHQTLMARPEGAYRRFVALQTVGAD